jgi:hypothetical protein
LGAVLDAMMWEALDAAMQEEAGVATDPLQLRAMPISYD